jgi:WD40 repeat protein
MRQELLYVTLILGHLVWPLAASAGAVPPARVLEPKGGVESVAVDPAGSWLVTGGDDGTVRLWDLRADDAFSRSSFVLRGHGEPVGQLAITPNGRRLASCSPDGMLRLWDLSAPDPGVTGQLLWTSLPKDPHRAKIGWRPEMSGNSRWLVATAGWDADKTTVWDLRAADARAKPVELPRRATVGLCPGGRWLVAGREPRAETAQVWDLNADDSWARSLTLPIPRGASVEALSPDGRWLFARSRDPADRSKDRFLVWDLKEAAPAAKVLISHEWMSPPRAGDISPDGRWLAVAFDVEPYGIDLWDLRGDDPAARHVVLAGHKDTVRELVFSPNSRWLVTAGDDATARLWDLAAPEPQASCRLLPVNTELAVVSANSRWLATSDKRTVRVWDLEAPDPAATGVALGGSDQGLRSVRITADVRWLVTHGEDRTVRCWDLRTLKR